MEEKELEKIENDILDNLKDKLKSFSGKELEKIIEDEVKRRNYLPEDYHIYYATQRIIEKFKKEELKDKKQPLRMKPITKTRKVWLWVCLVVLSFLFVFLLTEIIFVIYFFVISGGRIKSSEFLNLGGLIFVIVSAGYGILKISDMIRFSKKTKRIVWGVNIVLATLLFLLLIMRLPSGIVNQSVSVDFKNLSSEEVIAKINNLTENKQVVAYKQHSVLGSDIGKIWTENLNAENKNFDLAFQKTLPILISQGWSDQSARDILSWEISKSLIILYRDPSWWCKSGDCTAKSDAEIRSILREDKSLPESVIFGIFQELRIDEGLSPLPELPKL